MFQKCFFVINSYYIVSIIEKIINKELNMKKVALLIMLILLTLSPNLFSQVLTKDGKSPFVEVIKNVRESVVNIQVEGERRISQGNRFPFDDDFFRFFFPPREYNRPFSSMGSGFIFRKDGNVVYIMTNNHVVEAGKNGTITVTLADKEKLPAEIVGLDPETDLAIIKVTVNRNTQVVVAELGDSDNLDIGEWAIAIGNPFGELGLQRTVTVGVISAVGRSGLNFGGSSPVFQDYIQTDAAINPGNSGGPLLDINGRVIGVNAAITTTSGGNVGIGFAIPISLAKKVADDFLSHGRVVRAYLGIMPQEISPEISNSLGLKEIAGVLVSRVENNTPAEKAGLKVGDVILSFDDQKIDNVSRFRIVVANSAIDKKIPVKINRDGKERTISVILKDREGISISSEPSQSSKSFDLGMRLDTLDSDIAKRMTINVDSGLVVTHVNPNSPAAKSGIRPGDVIIELNKYKLNTLRDYDKAIDSAEKDKLKVILAYVLSRDGTYKFVPFSID